MTLPPADPEEARRLRYFAAGDVTASLEGNVPIAPSAEGAPVLVDIREGYERARVPVGGAVTAPLFDVLAGTADLPRSRLIVVAEDAPRAAFGARVLRERGFDAVALDRGASDL